MYKRQIWHDIKKEKTVGVLDENEMEGYVEVAKPVGVIAGVTPTTNPTSTTLFKSLIAVKTRNPIIFGFHPVSYTHLDVYKRQLLGNPQAVYHKSPCFSRLNFPFSAAMPARMRS